MSSMRGQVTLQDPTGIPMGLWDSLFRVSQPLLVDINDL